MSSISFSVGSVIGDEGEATTNVSVVSIGSAQATVFAIVSVSEIGFVSAGRGRGYVSCLSYRPLAQLQCQLDLWLLG